MMHRVRVGPFETREAAEKAKQKLGTAGVETALVRVQR
jgi:cell division protein FtsN